jgi:hypothetical protein
MVSPPSFSCPHTCCDYSTARRNDRDKHVKTRHKRCTPNCSSHEPAEGIAVVMETAESMAQKLSRPNKRQRRASIETQKAAPEPRLDRAKILCVLDPTRRKRNLRETQDVSWLIIEPGELQLDDFQEILSCEALSGYVFLLGKGKKIIIYDWVSTRAYTRIYDVHVLCQNPISGVRGLVLHSEAR